MKKSINRSYFWANLFVNQLHQSGVRQVCISPGSRNTPLTLAFANNSKFKKYLIVDERSSAFFALGIAKQTNKPIAVVTTSGTAVAELYPAIIEAYYQRVGLVICTADRPPFLRNTGANQTINQENIFGNHIRFFKDFGLPNLNKNKLRRFVSNIIKGIDISWYDNPGPVHFNFPFKKPFEPDNYTDEIDFDISDLLIKSDKSSTRLFNLNTNNLIKSLHSSERPLIHCGWDNFSNAFNKKLVRFSLINNIPLLTDGTSKLRFIKSNNSTIITNHSSFLEKSEKDSDLIIQFGNAPTSQSMLRYLEQTDAERFLVNQYGDIKDPSKNKGILIKIDPVQLLDKLSKIDFTNNWKNWRNYICNYEKIAEKMKKMITTAAFGNESRIVPELLENIPDNSNLFISNSLPIRDFDYFASKKKSNFQIYINRGASGIDGIISAASGVASNSNSPSYLIVGDLAFYHNLTALSSLNQLKIPLRIILINNFGGNIFRMLPVASNNKYFKEYFLTPQYLDYSKITKAFNGKFFNPQSWSSFRNILNNISNKKSFCVIEIKTNAQKSVKMREMYWSRIAQNLNSSNASKNK